jgi:hypothetical protein
VFNSKKRKQKTIERRSLLVLEDVDDWTISREVEAGRLAGGS